MSRPLRLLLLNAFSNNLGDQAILFGFINSFVPAALKRGFDCKIDQQFVYNFQIHKDNIDEINQKYDLIVIGGGGLIFYRPKDNSASGWGFNIPYDLIDKLKVPFVGYALGYNFRAYSDPFFPSQTDLHLQKVVERAMFFSVREHGSMRCLQEDMQVTGPIEFLPDCAIHVEPIVKPLPGLDPHLRKIAVCLRLDMLPDRFPPPFEQSYSTFVKEILETFRILILDHGFQVVYVPHMLAYMDGHFGNMLQHSELCKHILFLNEIMPELYGKARIENASLLLGVYQQMDVVLGKRIHSVILPFRAQTPVVSISTTPSNGWMMEEFGCPDFHIDIRDFANQVNAQNIVNKILVAYQRSEELKKLFGQKLEQFFAISAAQNEKIFDRFIQMI